MMTPIKEISEIDKIIRPVLIKQSELQDKRVLNGLTTHGVMLQRLIQDQVYQTLEPDNNVLIFGLHGRTDDPDKSMTEEDGSIIHYVPYEMKLIMYGSRSETIMDKLIGRLRTAEVRQELYAQGIYLQNVLQPRSTEEFINETMWLRTDSSINIYVMLRHLPVDEDVDIKDFNKIEIKSIGG